MVRRTFPGQRCCRQNPGSCASKMGEKCQSYLYAGAGRTKEQIIKENYPVLGDSGRALCEVETKAQDRRNSIIRLWRVMIFQNGIRTRNGCLERLDGRAAGSSITNRNFPGLRMMQKRVPPNEL